MKIEVLYDYDPAEFGILPDSFGPDDEIDDTQESKDGMGLFSGEAAEALAKGRESEAEETDEEGSANSSGPPKLTASLRR